jgi:ABC-2 type transport system permease protein
MATMVREPIDKRQLKALLKASLKTDLRSSSSRFGGERKSPLGIPPIAFVLLMYFMMSLGLTMVAIGAQDVFLGAFFVIAMQMVFIAITILLEFSNLILSPDDFPILAPHPVNSRTFFVAKMLHLGIYVTLLVISLGLIPAVVAAIKYKDVLLGPVMFLASWSSGIATALFFAVFYTLMLRLGNRERMHRYLSYLQLLMMFFIYGGYQFLPDVGRRMLALTKSGFDLSYLYLAPPGWFAAWPAFLTGSISPAQVWAAIAGVVSMAVMYFLGISRLSIGYAQTLNETVEQQQSKSESKREVRGSSGIFNTLIQWFSAPEDRVVWQLMRKQFKYDNRYKLSVLMIIPLTLLYVYMGLKDGQVLADPFNVTTAVVRGGSNFTVYMVLAFIPSMVIFGSAYSASYQAAWIYYTSPADRTRLVLASNRFATIFFCIPYLVFMCALMTYFFDSILHAILHCIVLFLVLLVLVDLIALIAPRIPFSLPMKSGQRTGAMMITMFIPMIIVLVGMQILSHVGYGGVIGYGTIVFVLILIVLLLSHLQRRLIPRRLAKIEFVET